MGGDLSAKMQEPYLILYFLTGVPLVGFSENLVHLGVGMFSNRGQKTCLKSSGSFVDSN